MARKRIFGMCALWPWPWRYDLGSRSWVMTHPGHGQQLCDYYPDQTWQWEVTARTRILDNTNVVPVTLTLEIWPWVKVLTHPRVMDSNCVKYYPDQTAVRGNGLDTDFGLGMCALWTWPWRYDLGLRSWHTIGTWTTVVWSIIQIQHGRKKLLSGHGFWVIVHCDLDLRDLSLCQGYDTPLGHGKQLCKLLSRSDKGLEVMARTRCEQTDRQTGWFLYTPNFFAGCIIKEVWRYMDNMPIFWISCFGDISKIWRKHYIL